MTSPSEKAPEHIFCPDCEGKSTRVGAQDSCDVYVCESDTSHLTRIKVGAPRKVWNELGSGSSKPPQ